MSAGCAGHYAELTEIYSLHVKGIIEKIIPQTSLPDDQSSLFEMNLDIWRLTFWYQFDRRLLTAWIGAGDPTDPEPFTRDRIREPLLMNAEPLLNTITGYRTKHTPHCNIFTEANIARNCFS
jgi:hypothetical protein